MPPTVADLIFTEQANHNFSKTLGDIKRRTLSIHNRLKSILEDAQFAHCVAEAYGRPLIANERCGSWYIDPEKKSGSAYFKSTDGHTGVWKFSSRRLNLHLLEIVGKNDGCIIVDSTRRGKRMPDALSKTIPIWCCVLNRVLFPSNKEAHNLYTPPQVVSDSEHAQIANLIPSFVEAFRALNIPEECFRDDISKPLRPVWVTPESHINTTDNIFDEFHPIICCTVSRRVTGGEASEGGYIQGAGDDTENWAYGLTPKVFWNDQRILLETQEEGLPDLIEKLVHQHSTSVFDHGLRLVKPTTCLFISDMSALSSTDISSATCVIAIIPKVTPRDMWHASFRRLDVGLGSKKVGSKNLRVALKDITEFVAKVLDTPASNTDPENRRIIIACETGQDLAVGVGLALLCICFHEDGRLKWDFETSPTAVNKDYIRQRLSWISTSMPDANPSRATLQSVNSFLMPY